MEIIFMVIFYLWLFRIIWDNFLLGFVNYIMKITGRNELPRIKQPKQKRK